MAATYDERLKEIKLVVDLVDFESESGHKERRTCYIDPKKKLKDPSMICSLAPFKMLLSFNRFHLDR
jgi:hypothetical protein